MLSLHASCGVFGDNTMCGIWRLWEDNYGVEAFTLEDPLWLDGCKWMFFFLNLVRISFDLFTFTWFIGASLVYFLYTWVGPLCVTNEFNLLNPKEKKKISLLKYYNNQFFRGVILIKDTVAASLVPIYEKCWNVFNLIGF